MYTNSNLKSKEKIVSKELIALFLCYLFNYSSILLIYFSIISHYKTRGKTLSITDQSVELKVTTKVIFQSVFIYSFA